MWLGERGLSGFEIWALMGHLKRKGKEKKKEKKMEKDKIMPLEFSDWLKGFSKI